MFVRRPIAQVINVQLDDSLFLCAFHDALAQWCAADFREQRDDVDLHRERNIERPTSNVQRRIVETPRRLTQTPYNYSTISKTARCPWRAAELASAERRVA